MFSKVIVGITGAVLLGIGGFLYWDHQCCSCARNDAPLPIATPACCQHLPEGISISTSDSSDSETLEIMPREVTP